VIARIWRGWAPQATTDDYQHHYESEVSNHLSAASGFRGARLLRRPDGQEVMFTSIAFFTSLDAVRSLAEDDYEQAVVQDTARQALTRWDVRVSHHEVAVDLP
jgi:heme-degrading monooxygenase HmoA